MTLNPGGYALIGLTAIIACLAAILTFAVLRFIAAARAARGRSREGGVETVVLTAALQDAVNKLKVQERAMAARADASERLSGEIISSLASGLLVSDLRGNITILNPAGRRMLDLPESSDAYKRGEREGGLLDVVDECLRTRQPIARREVTLSGNGRGIHLGVSVSPLSDAAGQPHGAICLFTDLTAVKDLEEQLRLKESLATLGELTAGIAHEFRNGLATIHGYSKLFDLSALPETYRPYVEGIRAETEALNQVVTNFLNFARPAQLTLSRVDLASLCERAADEVRGDVQALGGDVKLEGEFGTLEGDDVLLRQAFSNLLRNAVEACTEASVSPRIGIHSEVDAIQHQSRITITDNGPGIAPELRERVFRPFFTSKRNGTGLGLALVQKIVVFHNGRIVAGVTPQGGASLQITLPIAS